MTPDIDLDSISFMCKIKKNDLKMKDFPYFWFYVYFKDAKRRYDGVNG